MINSDEIEQMKKKKLNLLRFMLQIKGGLILLHTQVNVIIIAPPYNLGIRIPSMYRILEVLIEK